MDGENPSVDSGGDGDFVVTSSGSPEPAASAAPAAAASSPPPAGGVTPPDNTEAAPAEPPTEEKATSPEAEPASATDPEVAAAAARLPKGDSKAGKTLSDRGRMIQAEIHQLTAQKYQTRAEAEAARAELAELRAERQRLADERQQQQKQTTPAPTKPKSEDFDTFEAYTDALGQFYRDEAKRDAIAQAQELVQQTLRQEQERFAAWQQQQQLNEVYARHNKNIEAARAAHPDFDEVVAGSALPTNEMMKVHIPQSHLSGELLHYLATHPDECTEIAQMNAGPTLVALGRLEARIEAAKSGPVSTRPPVSKAQPPIKPVGASGRTADDDSDADVSLDSHVTYWNRKERERRRAGVGK